MITITWQTIITAGAVIAALAAILSKYNKGYDFIKRQNLQDDEIKALRAEQTIILKGVLACLKGLSEQGCDGPVHEAEKEIEQYLIKNRATTV